MPKDKTDDLVALINSLTKSEKRNFSLLTRGQNKETTLYVALYKHIERYKNFDEKLVLKKIPTIKKSQLSNLKTNLYKKILRSLRDIHKESYLEIKAREQFDFAKVLYAKGQYKASLEMLNKVKTLSKRLQKHPLEYLVISFEKHIESQHITGSMSPKAEALAKESKKIIENLIVRDQLSNLSLMMYGKYIQMGIVRSKSEKSQLSQFLKKHIPDDASENKLDFYQSLYLYQSYVWYFMMIQNFSNYYKYARKWVDLFESNLEMQQIETVTYIKGIHNVLNALYMSDKPKWFAKELSKFESFNNDNRFDLSINEKSQLDLFKYTHLLNLIFLNANYLDGVKIMTPLLKTLERHPNRWDINRTIVFHYKIACVYFGASKLDETIFFLNKITNNHTPGIKEDIQCFARILKLITHYDLGDMVLVSYDVRSVYRLLLKMAELQAVQKEILKFVRKIPSINPDHINREFISLRDKLTILEQDKLERRPFLYLDIISWLNSKIENISISDAIKRRQANR